MAELHGTRVTSRAIARGTRGTLFVPSTILPTKTFTSFASAMHIFALGASRNIGYHASLCKYDWDSLTTVPTDHNHVYIVALARGDTVTFLLRNSSILEEDSALKPYIQSGHAIFVQGDATSQEDVRKAWGVASSKAPVDLILFTIGEGSVLHVSDESNISNAFFRRAGWQVPPSQRFYPQPSKPLRYFCA